jgi:hypothetical protein
MDLISEHNQYSYKITFNSAGTGTISFSGDSVVINSWSSGTFLIVCTSNNSWAFYSLGSKNIKNMTEGYNQLAFPTGVNTSLNLSYLINNTISIDGDSSNYYIFLSNSNTNLSNENFKNIFARTSYSQINITNNTTLDVSADAYFNILPNAIFSTINVTSGSTLIINATQLDGLNVTGSGTVNILGLNNIPGVNLSNVTASNINITMSADTTFTSNSRLPGAACVLNGNYKLILASSNNIANTVSLAAGTTIESIGTYISGETITGSGNVTITQMSSNTNLTNISVSGTKIATFIDNVTYSASLLSWNVIVNATKTLNVDAAYITNVTATGSGTINITALNSTLNSVLTNVTISTINVSMNANTILNSSARLPGAAFTLNGLYKLTISDVNTLSTTCTVASGTTVEGNAAYLTGKTLNGVGIVNVLALDATLGALLDNIITNTVNVSMSANTVLLSSARLPGVASNLNGAFKLTVSDSANISHSVTVATTTVVEGTAAHLSDKTLNGSGTVNVLDLNATLGALLNNITTNAVNVTMSADTVLLASARLPGVASNLNGAFKLTVSDSSNISHNVTVSSNTVVEGTAAHLSGKTLNGSGTVNVLALDATLGALLNNITATNINVSMSADSVLLPGARLPGSASNLNGAYKLTVSNSSNISHSVTVGVTSIVEGTAAHLSGKTLNGFGTVNVLELNNTVDALLNSITSSNINVTMDSDSILTVGARLPGSLSNLNGPYKLTLSNVNNIVSTIAVASTTTVEGTAAYLTGKTLNGSGTVNVLALNATLGALLDNITATTVNVTMKIGRAHV